MIVGQSIGTTATTRAGDDRRRPRGAARGAGAHPLQLDRRHPRDGVPRTARGGGRLGGRATLRSRRRAGARGVQQHLQARGDRGVLSVDRWLRALHRPDLRNGQRVGRQPPRSGPGRCGRGQSRSRPPGGRSWRSRGARSMRSAAGSPANPSRTTRRSKRSSRSSTSSNRSRWRPPTWPRSGPASSASCHALDHLTQLHDDLTRIPPAVAASSPRRASTAGARRRSPHGSTPPRTPRRHPIRPSSWPSRKPRERLSVECKTGAREDAGGRRPATHARGDGARRSRHARVGRRHPLSRLASGRIAANRLGKQLRAAFAAIPVGTE